MVGPKKEIIVKLKKDKNLQNKILYLILGIILFYILTSSTAEFEIVEVMKTDDKELCEDAIVGKIKQEPYQVKVPISTEGCSNYPYNWSTLPESYKAFKGESFVDEEAEKNYLKCNITVFNYEEKAGVFKFYSRDEQDQEKEIPARGSVTFEWIHELFNVGDNLCKVTANDVPVIYKCLETEETVYKLVTKYRNVTVNKTDCLGIGEYEKVTELVKETKCIYTNRVFGYNQFFYLGY